MVPTARILPQWFHVYFCSYSPLPACIFPTNLVDTTRQHCEAAACHWMQPSLLSVCQVLALLPFFSAARGMDKCANSSVSPQESRPEHPSLPQPHKADSLTNALVISASGNTGTQPLVSSPGVPVLSHAVPEQQSQGLCVEVTKFSGTLTQLLQS